MSPLSRNARRRLALYGGAAAVAAAVWALPRVLAWRQPGIPVRRLDLEAAAAMEKPEVKLLVEILRLDSSNPPGITRPVVDVFARELGCAGIPYVVTGHDPQRPILVARLSGRRRGEALALLAHADVVPAGDLSAWVKPPFAAERGDKEYASNLIGRGVLDMKGQAVANLLALTALARSGIVPERDVLFVVESGEESYDQSLGFGWLLANRPDLVAGVTDVFNEGGVNEVNTTEIGRFGIEVMQKAILSVDVFAAEKGPLEDLAASVKARDEAEPLKVVPAVRDFLRFIAPSRSDVWGRRMLDDPSKIGPGTEFWKVVPEVYRSLLKDMAYTGRAAERPEGGFSMRLVRTLLPGSSVAAAEAELDGWLGARRLTKRVVLRTDDCVASPAEGPAWRAVTEVFELDPAHAPVGPYVLSGQYTSSSFLRARGLRAFGVSPFAVSYFDATTIHHHSERMVVPFYLEGLERMRRILFEFATAP
jgi:acetylornithine deacetylase/succinyl-diaminopimelate desuccinylase-like protein